MAIRVWVLGVGSAVVQLIDIGIHAATNQLEPLRVLSNLIVLAGLAVVASGRLRGKFEHIAIVATTLVYVGLNGIFLAREGVTNAAQGGEPRVALFGLVLLTIALSLILTYLLRPKLGSDSAR